MKISDKVKLTIIKTDYWFRNFLLKSFNNILFSKDFFDNVNKILVFRTGSLGDSVCALPAINIIRKNYPNAQIDILTNSGHQSLVALKDIIKSSIVNYVIDYLDISKGELTKQLKKNSYDLFIELPQDQQTLTRQFRNMFWVKMLGIKKAFGWQMAATRVFPSVQDKFIIFKNERERLVNILKQKHFNVKTFEYPLNIDDNITRRIKDLLKVSGSTDKFKNIGLVVGAKRSQNRWPKEYFNEVIDYLTEKNFNILLFGDKKDLELTTDLTGENVFNFCGELKPLETAEMMKYCRVVISNDTGPMHLSYAVGTPVIAIFSSRDYKNKWYPPKENVVLRSNKNLCSYCFIECKFENECLKQINPSQVIEELNHFVSIR